MERPNRWIFLLLCFAAAAPAFAQMPMTIRSDGLSFPDATVQTTAAVTVGTEVGSLPGTSTAVHAITQPGSYYLSADVIGESAKDGISIDADDVTLELNGFRVRGVAGSEDGIFLDGSHNRVTVRNGFVSAWDGHGVRLQQGKDVHVERVVAADNGGWGFLLQSASGTILDSQARNNSLGGFSLQQGLIVRSVAIGNTGSGFQIGGLGGVAVHLLSDGNTGSGLSQSSGSKWVIENSTFTNNDSHGINVCGANQIRHNLAGSNGTEAGDAGINLRCGSNMVHDNLVYNNNVGIASSDNGDDVVFRNIANGNSTAFATGTGNDFGPAEDAATGTSPWGNIEH